MSTAIHIAEAGTSVCRSALKTLTFLSRDGSLNNHHESFLLTDCLARVRSLLEH